MTLFAIIEAYQIHEPQLLIELIPLTVYVQSIYVVSYSGKTIVNMWSRTRIGASFSPS